MSTAVKVCFHLWGKCFLTIRISLQIIQFINSNLIQLYEDRFMTARKIRKMPKMQDKKLSQSFHWSVANGLSFHWMNVWRFSKLCCNTMTIYLAELHTMVRTRRRRFFLIFLIGHRSLSLSRLPVCLGMKKWWHKFSRNRCVLLHTAHNSCASKRGLCDQILSYQLVYPTVTEKSSPCPCLWLDCLLNNTFRVSDPSPYFLG